MRLLSKALKTDAGAKINGPDVIPKLLNKAKGQTLGVLGTREPHLSKAAELLKQAGHNVIICEDGFKDKTSYLRIIQRYRPKIIVLEWVCPNRSWLPCT